MEYIYPKGNTGKILGAMVEYVNGESPKFIDDSICGSSILDYKDEILRIGAKVSLAWDKKSGWNDSVMQKLTLKLSQLGIPYDEDIFYKYSLKVVNKLKNEVYKNKAKYIVGIELGGMAEDKHLGILDDELVKISKNELLLIYFCGFYQSYERISQKILENNLNAMAVCLSPFDLELVDFVDVLCKVSWTQKNMKIKTIEIGHCMSDKSKCNLDEYSNYFDFYCAQSESFLPKLNAKKVVCIKSGYLAFDKTYPLLAQKRGFNSKDFSLYGNSSISSTNTRDKSNFNLCGGGGTFI